MIRDMTRREAVKVGLGLVAAAGIPSAAAPAVAADGGWVVHSVRYEDFAGRMLLIWEGPPGTDCRLVAAHGRELRRA